MQFFIIPDIEAVSVPVGNTLTYALMVYFFGPPVTRAPDRLVDLLFSPLSRCIALLLE